MGLLHFTDGLKTDLGKIQKTIRGKKVMLIGNGLKRKNNEIDYYDIVVRLNRAFPNRIKDWDNLGTKTDFVITSYNFTKSEYSSYYSNYYNLTPMIMWAHFDKYGASPKYAPSKWLQKYAYQYPTLYRSRLRGKIDPTYNTKVSTGTIAIDFLIHYTEFKHLDLFGFDFWQSTSVPEHPHNLEAETNYVKELIKGRDNVCLLQ